MSKKVKGTKVDLATFVGDTSASTMNTGLPAGPRRDTQTRESGNRFSQLEDGSSDYRSAGGGAYRGGGDEGYGGRPSRDEMPESAADGDNNWRKSAPSGGSNFSRPQGGGGGFGGDRGGGGYGGDRESSNAERPKLDLAPRSVAGARPTSSATETGTKADDGDKWSTVFKSSATTSNRGTGGVGGGFGGGSGDGRRTGGDFSGGTGGDRFGGGGGSYGGRSRRDEEPIDDPRFKFSGGDRRGGDRGGGAYGQMGRRDGRGGYDRAAERGPIPLPTAPRGAIQAPVAPKASIPKGPSVEELQAIENAKLAKVAKKADREAAEKSAREKKEAALVAEKERKEKESEDAGVAGTAAVALVSSGLKGSALVELANSSSDAKVTGAAVLKEILLQSADVLSSEWWTKAEYGEILSTLLAASPKNELAALYSVQSYCAEKKFPKVQVKGVTKKVIESLFSILLTNQLIDGETFVTWADDDDGSDSLGRLDAIVQTTTLLNSIRDALLGEDSEGEEEDEEEIDAPREFV